MSADFEAAFEALKGLLQKHSKRLMVGSDTSTSYSVSGRVASPFPQHKGKPLGFSEVRMGKAYVSFHLVALYMNPHLEKKVPVGLKKRMQGKACFNFKQAPEPELMAELERLTVVALEDWAAKGWL